MKKFLQLIILSLLLSACTTMPPEIEEKYLVQKTGSDSKIINSLEERIIAKNREKQEVDSRIRNLSRTPDTTEDEIKLLKKENGLLKDQIYLYEKNKDAVNLEAKKKQLADNDAILDKKIAQFNYSQSERKLLETELDLKDAELAVLIAELNNEKSKIAAAYRDKNEPPKPAEKENFFTKLLPKNDPNDKYGYKKYPEYLEKKKQEQSKAETDYREALKKFNETKAALEKLNG